VVPSLDSRLGNSIFRSGLVHADRARGVILWVPLQRAQRIRCAASRADRAERGRQAPDLQTANWREPEL